jgi:hypothetical protein
LVCDQLVYNLNVEAYPSTKEITYRQFCDSCEKKEEASLTPEQRAARERVSAAGAGIIRQMESLGGAAGAMVKNVMAGAAAVQAEEEQQRAAELAPAMRINLSDMTSYIYVAFRKDSRMKPVNRHIVVTGTVASLEVSSRPPDRFYNVYFKEDPEHQFAFCASSADDVFGPDFATRMAGKKVEIEGQLNKWCHGANGSIRVVLEHQMRVPGPGHPETVAHVWSPSDNPIPSTTPAPPPSAPAVTAPPAETVRTESRRPSTQAAPVQPAQPRPAIVAPVTPVAPVRDPFIDNVIAYLKARMPEIQIMLRLKQRNKPLSLTGDDRARLEDAGASEKLIDAMINPASIGAEITPQNAASQQRERYATCQAQATRQYPNDAAARNRALTNCLQAK